MRISPQIISAALCQFAARIGMNVLLLYTCVVRLLCRPARSLLRGAYTLEVGGRSGAHVVTQACARLALRRAHSVSPGSGTTSSNTAQMPLERAAAPVSLVTAYMATDQLLGSGRATSALLSILNQSCDPSSDAEGLEELERIVERVWKRMTYGEFSSRKWTLKHFLDIRDLYERMGGSMRRTRLVLNVVSDGFPEQLSTLLVAYETRSTTDLKYAAYAARVVLLDVGARLPVELCMRIEELCKKELAGAASQLVPSLIEQMVMVSRVVKHALYVLNADTSADSPSSSEALV